MFWGNWNSFYEFFVVFLVTVCLFLSDKIVTVCVLKLFYICVPLINIS